MNATCQEANQQRIGRISRRFAGVCSALMAGAVTLVVIYWATLDLATLNAKWMDGEATVQSFPPLLRGACLAHQSLCSWRAAPGLSGGAAARRFDHAGQRAAMTAFQRHTGWLLLRAVHL